MSQEEKDFSVWGFIKGFGKLLIGFLLLVQGLIGLVVMLLVVGVIISVSSGFAGGGRDRPTIPQDVALVINPSGFLVEEAEERDPFLAALQEAYGTSDPAQIEVHSLARAIREAASDDRIKGLVLALDNLQASPSSASKLHFIAAEIDAFKESGKPVFATGDSYTQEQYLLASRADTVMMHEMGSLVLNGYGAYTTFYRALLEKLLVTPHVFRVGTFKAAVEPFLRDDMSDEAKEANLGYLSVLWREYISSVAKARKLDEAAVRSFADDYNGALGRAGGHMAKAAVDARLVDTLKSRSEQLAALQEVFGKSENGKGYKSVSLNRYVAALAAKVDGEAPNVAVVTASGAIVDGEAARGSAAGGDTIAGYLRKAREDDNVKAVVLRVDSPGGSAFASEIIRDEIIALKRAGKPVVASMSSLAASGGYWISAPADEIWATPTTITGSIGIFAFFATFENAAKYWGVNVDGVGTTPLSVFDKAGLGALEDNVADIFQQSIEHGYRDFLSVVAEGRDLDRDYVDSIAQGRVWIGETALGLKLVDNLGELSDAVAAAARLANLDDYDVVTMYEENLSPFSRIFGLGGAKLMMMAGVPEVRAYRTSAAFGKVVRSIEERMQFFDSFNDPKSVYARCLACEF